MNVNLNPSMWSGTFVFHLDEMPINTSYVMLKDRDHDGEALQVLQAKTGKDRGRGYVASAADTPADCHLVISSKNWPTLASRAVEHIDPSRLIVLLHFGFDPHGYWDFALCLKDQLERMVVERDFRADTFEQATVHSDFWMSSRSVGGRMSGGALHLMQHYPEVLAARSESLVYILSKLSDQKSRDAFTRILFGNQEQVMRGFLADAFGPQQYMDIVRLRPGDTVINGGVGAGWEIPYFVCQMKGEGRIHSFDPAFQFKGHWAEPTWNAFEGIISKHEVALLDSDRMLRLATQVSGMVYGAGGEDVDAAAAAGAVVKEFKGRSLDSLVTEGLVTACDYVKLDIEGGEPVALKGMEHSLRRFRPKLSIAIYHEPEHFFDIPERLMRLLPDYRWYVRQYSCGRFETLLYGVPNEDTNSRSGYEFGPDNSGRSSEKDAPLQVITYVQDRIPRLTHRGQTLMQVDRFSGGDWAFATLDARVELDGLRAVSLVDDGAGGHTHLVAVREAPDAPARLFIGKLTVPWGIEWLASRDLAEGIHVPVVGLQPEAAVVAEFLPSRSELYIYCLADGFTEGVAIIPNLPGRPLCIHQGEMPDTFTLLAESPEGTCFVEARPGTITNLIPVDTGPVVAFEAVCTVHDHAAEGSPLRYGYVFREPSTGARVVYGRNADGALSALRDLTVPDFVIVNTGTPSVSLEPWPPATRDAAAVVEKARQTRIPDRSRLMREGSSDDALIDYARWAHGKFFI
jgi:FkbM family methyltransferase